MACCSIGIIRLHFFQRIEARGQEIRLHNVYPKGKTAPFHRKENRVPFFGVKSFFTYVFWGGWELLSFIL
jgi:hypothetical protein